MAALAGCGVHNALIEVDGPEFPILDGSAVPFVRAILGAGVVSLDAPVRAIRILAPVEFKTDQGWARFEPSMRQKCNLPLILRIRRLENSRNH